MGQRLADCNWYESLFIEEQGSEKNGAGGDGEGGDKKMSAAPALGAPGLGAPGALLPGAVPIPAPADDGLMPMTVGNDERKQEGGSGEACPGAIKLCASGAVASTLDSSSGRSAGMLVDWSAVGVHLTSC